MKRVLIVAFLICFCEGQDALKGIHIYDDDISYSSKQEPVLIGHINEFILDQGHPSKKPSVFGYAIIQRGKLKEFVLDQGYPSKIKPAHTLSNFKIIIKY